MNSAPPDWKRLTVGIDPDISAAGLAASLNGFLISVALAKGGTGTDGERLLHMIEAITDLWPLPSCEETIIVVERPEIRRYGQERAVKDDIARLAVFAGGLAAQARALLGHTPNVKLFLPTPQEWKGSVPKEIHQARLCKRLKWEYNKRSGYVVPDCPFTGKFPDGGWKHVMDAVGLCLWGFEHG